jgi:hypothetical protein
MQHLKVKLILIAFCLCAVAASQFYLRGFDAGIQSVDDDALTAYIHFAKPFQAKVKQDKAARHSTETQTAQAEPTVWTAIDRPSKKHR